ncbi:hypothetical protein EV643_112101 [Kribbella sp. VKM Ac-2527]|uniref:Peptidase inhibitor family I36 n=2 Tax=Kribbella caucasensis TaxID=2512215 RepID=A0A4R6K9C5_9ACTN|nr:hypothetical protein EV643_112101 [Kribbella sp. VKM Ac-2527]
MKSWRRVMSKLLVLPLAIVGVVGSPGVASAAVTVPPGAAGHTCSEYQYVNGLQHYWQACAWADYRYVWFTANFGNTGSSDWRPDTVYVNYIKSGVSYTCYLGWWQEGSFNVPANSVTSTPRSACVLTRVPGAYAADVHINDSNPNYGVTAHSPTLQVQ